LVGDDVGLEASVQQLGVGLGAVADQGDAGGFAALGGVLDDADRLLEVVGLVLAVADVDAFVGVGFDGFDGQAGAAGDLDGQGLGAAHAAEAAGEHGLAL
jgi:hypothetical protein